ncbi:MAG: hypothetical protein KFW07_00080 [Mycoplasmataceae bacterium]|nr:hypothetical protein [Mycoplasmataceae bacterium]
MKKNKLKNKGNNQIILNTKIKSWVKPLYTLFVVAIPSFFIWLFLGKDFIDEPPFEIYYNILIAISFIIIVFLLTFFLIYFNILNMSILTFVVPIIISFMTIFLTSWLPKDLEWARILIIIPLIFLVIPVNILVDRYERRKLLKSKIKLE